MIKHKKSRRAKNIIRKRGKYLTKNLVRGCKVYDEELLLIDGFEFRSWNPFKSKLAAAMQKGLKQDFDFKTVLYLGCSTGTTVSHISDIIPNGIIFAVDIAPRVMRDMVFVAEHRKNIAPILADASQPDSYADRISSVDFLYQDVAQRNQAGIFIRASRFLKKGGVGLLMIKAKSISVSRKAKSIYNEAEQQLNHHFKVEDRVLLDPFQKDHCCFAVRKIL